MKKVNKSNLKKKLRDKKFKNIRNKFTKPVILNLIEKMIQVIERDVKFSFQLGERKFLTEKIYEEYKILNKDIGNIKNKDDLRQVMTDVYKRVDDNIKDIFDNIGVKVSCSKGCSHCCHQIIGTSFPSLYMITPHVDENLLERANEFIEDGREFGKACVLTRTPCVFLKDNSCSVYQDRPFPCRSYFSVKPAIDCMEHYINQKQVLQNSIPSLVVGYGQLMDSITDFVFDSHGYQRIYDKNMAIFILEYHKTDNFIEKWLNKEDIV